jgi:phosphate starvation-inducible PhoH-like protein
MIEKTIGIDRIENLINVFGSFDENLRIIENDLSVRIIDREAEIRIAGDAERVTLAEKAIEALMGLAARGENITTQNVRYILKLVSEGRGEKISEMANDVVCITARGKPIKAKTLGQKTYVDAFKNNTITIGVGPAGTAKPILPSPAR